jgi:hypothetical protein
MMHPGDREQELLDLPGPGIVKVFLQRDAPPDYRIAFPYR